MADVNLGVLAAIATCVLSAVSRIILKKGLQGVSPLVATVVSMAIGFIALAVPAVPKLVAEGADIRRSGAIWFLFIGLIAPPVVRGLTYIGISQVGVARTDQIRSAQPLFAIFFAAMILGERPRALWYLAAGLTLAGVYFLVHEQRATSSATGVRSRGWVFPFAAAIIAGLVVIARKHGTELLVDPVLAAFFSATSGLLVGTVYLLWTGKWRELLASKASLSLLALAGVLTASTDILDIYALTQADVHIIVPILGTTPLFVTLLSSLFLKEEVITKKTWIAAVMIFLGLQLSVVVGGL